MADMCHLFLLGLAILSSLLAGTSGVDDAHVFISSGENVRLPCNNTLHDCTSTTWIYNKDSTAVELIDGGKKKKDTERHERLNLGSDCSLNINNISTEDYGFYTCRQWTGVNRGQKQGPDTRVYLHVLHVSQTEISAGLSVTLFCQLYSYAGVSCDDSVGSERIQLFWVNQAGVKLTILESKCKALSSSGHCICTLTIILLNEDQNREWRCEVTQRDQVKTSVTYTIKSSAPGSTLIPVSSSNSETTSSRTTAAAPTKDKEIITSNSEMTTAAHRPAVTPQQVMVIIVEFAAFAAPTVILLQIICARRAGRKDLQNPEEIVMNTILQ